jgi:hypothetical protein
MTITTKYYINDRVIITEVGISGTIVEIKIEAHGHVTYLIEYWNNGEIRSVWQDELQLKESKK